MILRRRAPLVIGGLLVLLCMSAVSTPSATGRASDEYLGLPDKPGREEVAGYCGACHSLRLVVQQGLTRTAWEELLVWMVEEQGMEKLEPEDEKLVLEYLAEYVGPEDHKERLEELGLRR